MQGMFESKINLMFGVVLCCDLLQFLIFCRVMNCLMDKLGTPQMTEPCESALLQIQYFVARDFKLDPQLYKQCRDDAVHLCHAKKVWYDDSGQMDPERGPLVLPCLYRNAYQSHKDQGERKVDANFFFSGLHYYNDS